MEDRHTGITAASYVCRPFPAAIPQLDHEWELDSAEEKAVEALRSMLSAQ